MSSPSPSVLVEMPPLSSNPSVEFDLLRATWIAQPFIGLGSNELRDAIRAKRQWPFTRLKELDWNDPSPCAELSILGRPEAPFAPVGGLDKTYLQRVSFESDAAVTRFSLSVKILEPGYLEGIYCYGHPALYDIRRSTPQSVYVSGAHATWSRIHIQVDIYRIATDAWSTLLARLETNGSARIPFNQQLMKGDLLRVFLDLNGVEPRALPYANEIDSRTGLDPRDSYWHVLGLPMIAYGIMCTEKPSPPPPGEPSMCAEVMRVQPAQQEPAIVPHRLSRKERKSRACNPVCYSNPDDTRNTVQLVGRLSIGGDKTVDATMFARIAPI